MMPFSLALIHFVAILGLTFGGAASAWGAVCDGSGLKNRLTITEEAMTIEFRNDLDYPAIQQESGLKPPAGMPAGSFVGGFTRTQVATQFKLESRSSPLRDGRMCFGVHAELRILQPKAIVFLPSSEPRDGCRYQITYAHEMQHVSIFQRGIRHSVRGEGLLMQQAFASSPAMVFNNQADAEVYFKKMMDVMQRRFQRSLDQSKIAQARIDTVENYLHEGEKVMACEMRRRK